ncbi:MAG: 50S ribosomal protein L9 [Deltaproteobacteria bacterium]|nr:MAG: 50S ribosomal protein L9 [Deltaproteobacteria bacterium]
MEVILREDVPGLGIIGEVVNVRRGYARNYLLPRGLAVVADRRNMKRLEHERRIIEAKKARERGAHEALAARLETLELEVEARAGKTGKLFGSVTNLDIHRLLAEKGYEIDRRRIELRDPIKEIGEYEVPIRVGQDVGATVKLVVRPLGGVLEGEAESPEEPGAGAGRQEESERTEASAEGAASAESGSESVAGAEESEVPKTDG